MNDEYLRHVIDRLRKEIAELIKLIKRLVPKTGIFGGDDSRGACVWCGGGIKYEIVREGGTYYIFDHAPDCPWVEASARLHTYSADEGS